MWTQLSFHLFYDPVVATYQSVTHLGPSSCGAELELQYLKTFLNSWWKVRQIPLSLSRKYSFPVILEGPRSSAIE